MDEPLDELYLKWLYHLVGNVKLKNPARTYWCLLKQLHMKEFVWIVPNDDNRLEDGRDLRHIFVDEEGLTDVDQLWMELGCSMLEMIIALAQKLEFEDDGHPADEWFWRMMENLNLHECTDASQYSIKVVDEILDTVIWRTYRRNGKGGLFPLHHAKKDQCEVELWYQMNAYILENN